MINIVVALPCEAQPIVKFFNLPKIRQTRVYHIYGNDQMRLIVSGVGKIYSAAATAYLQAVSEQEADMPYPCAWLNVGVAGHGNLQPGTPVLAHTIRDAASGICYYPGLQFEPMAVTRQCITVDSPETEFACESVYEMEAAGFYASASRFSSCELIHCFKVVSDNSATGIQHVDKAAVSQLITDQLTLLQGLISILNNMTEIIAVPETISNDMTALAKDYHLTKTQNAQLRRLLNRWYALNLGPLMQHKLVRDNANTKELLRKLNLELASQGAAY